MPNTSKLIVFVGICFSAAVKAPAIVVDISVGPISSNGGSGPMLPPIDRSSFLLYDETGWNDAIVYCAALKWVTASRFYPVLDSGLLAGTCGRKAVSDETGSVILQVANAGSPLVPLQGLTFTGLILD
ncbi:MAG: hypothetical protein OXN17_20910 [Candidatus Poribacteria bacterium]|nr:hypothetical protein [Candidatus Poribacteria bacterium]MDE0506556.1 hypothetical protein [Candidatus Poribacteria bacterium]